MIADRTRILRLVQEAMDAGARQSKAGEIVGVSAKTLQRWAYKDNVQDGRIDSGRAPPNKLSEIEQQRIVSVSNKARFAHLPPCKIVPLLADEGEFIASESSFYRVLKSVNQLRHRQAEKPKRVVKKPKALTATGPNQLYSWDISYLPTLVRGLFFYLYLVMDIYSRKIVGWQVYDAESSALAADLMADICDSEGIGPNQVTLHSDNGSPMKGATLLATLQHLGIVPSFSRPAVSNDNPYSESLFRTLKYRPEYPEAAFSSLTAARDWMATFVHWYNNEHLHSGIKFVTPTQRHTGADGAILANRTQVYRDARAKHPERWSGDIRNWNLIQEVYLNPENEKPASEKNRAA